MFSNKATSILPQTNIHDSDDSSSLGELCLYDLKRPSASVDKLKTEQAEMHFSNRPHQALEYPPLYFLLKRFPQLMESTKTWYMYRWKASYPLQRKLPCSRALRKIGVYLTWGEALLLLPFWTALASAMIYSVVFPSVIHSGHVARAGLIACFIFAQRNSLVTALVGMPIDRTLYYHKLSGRLALVATIGHAWAFYVDPRFQAGNARTRAKLASSLEGSVNTAGTMMATMLFIIILSSLPLVRRRLFELFYYLHILCAGGLAVSAFFHTGLLIVPMLVACTWGVDLFFRSIVMARHRYPAKATIRTLSATVIELSFPKVDGFDYNPGQYIYLCLPGISYLEWHPFSISSAPKMKNATLHIRRAGNWTSSLYELAKNGEEVDVLIEGPYGNLGVDLFGGRYKMAILVSGGIGITPMQSICDQLLFEEARKQRKLKKIKFVWTDRDPVMMIEAPVVRRMSSLDIEASSTSELGWAHADSDASIYERNSANIFSQLASLLPPGTAMDDDLDQFYDCLSELMDQDAELLNGSNLTSHDSCDDLDAMADDTSVADNNAPWDRDPECNKTLGEILEMQLYHTGARSDFHIPYAHHGRPDMKKIFLEMKKEAKEKGEQRVAVCVCAPKKLSALCRKASIVYSDNDVCFDFHAESMEA